MVIFGNRQEAGRILAEKLLPQKERLKNPIVFGIPRGGIAVGFSIAEALECPLDAISLRKLPVPESPEVGFGALTLDKTAIFNERLLSGLNLSELEINKIINNVYREVLRRNKAYRQDRPFPLLEERTVILSDDGLATGYTMLAAIKFAKKRGVGQLIAAVPVAHREAYNLVKKEADNVVVLHISDLPYFAVASFYREFPDMSDEEVVSYLKNNLSHLAGGKR